MTYGKRNIGAGPVPRSRGDRSPTAVHLKETAVNSPRHTKSFWRGFLLGGAALLLAGLAWQFVSQPPPAYGQVPDSGAQRQRIIKEMVTTNQKLSQVVDLLKQIRDQTAGDSAPQQRGKSSAARP